MHTFTQLNFLKCRVFFNMCSIQIFVILNFLFAIRIPKASRRVSEGFPRGFRWLSEGSRGFPKDFREKVGFFRSQGFKTGSEPFIREQDFATPQMDILTSCDVTQSSETPRKAVGNPSETPRKLFGKWSDQQPEVHQKR